jgi:hypothetical protein
MDRRQEGSVRRGDFVWALSAHGASLEFQRIVRKSRLSAYFKATAREISLEEFVGRVFPNTAAVDVLKMRRWSCFRRARNIVANTDTFKATPAQMKQVFSLMEEDECGTVSTNSLMRAQILSHADVIALLPLKHNSGDFQMNLEDFVDVVGPLLLFKYSEFGKDHGDSGDWEDSAVGQEIHDKFSEVMRTKLNSDVEQTHASQQSSVSMNVAEEANSVVPEPPPLPPGTVAALIARLRPSSPRQECFASDFGVSMLCHMEHSPIVSAF